MSESKTSKLERLQKRKQEIENTIKDLTARDKEKQRKARVTRLVQIGALSEKYFECVGVTPDKFEELLKRVVESVKNPNYS